MYRQLVIYLMCVGTLRCAPRIIRAPQALPVSVQGRVSSIPRIWVAGFVASGTREVDVNLETVRLLRTRLRAVTSVPIVDAEPLTIRTEQSLADVPYWRHLGEEHGSPLIVTGSVKLLLAPAQVMQRGLRTLYVPAAGRVLEATVVLINGSTGEIFSRTQLPTRSQYGLGRGSSGLALYFQLMDHDGRLVPSDCRRIVCNRPHGHSCGSCKAKTRLVQALKTGHSRDRRLRHVAQRRCSRSVPSPAVPY
jgi:hypothetical protein